MLLGDGGGMKFANDLNIFFWAVLSDEQMSNGYPFSLVNDEQMSNKVGVKHQPVLLPFFVWLIGGLWDWDS